MMRVLRPLFLLLVLGSVSSSCRDGTGPDEGGVPEDELTFVRFAETAPPLAQREVSFWAVRGADRGARIRYAPQAGEDEGEEFLEFEVPSGALLTYPDGRAFAPGDSVRITIRVVDASRFIFEFQPAGLRFDRRTPAELEVSYEGADRDYDEDGDEDGEDQEFEREFGFWRQERPGLPWFQVATVKLEDLEEAEAEIYGFTKYALAGN